MHDAAGAGGVIEWLMGWGQARAERAKARPISAPVPPSRRVTGNNDAAGEAAGFFTGRKQALGERH